MRRVLLHVTRGQVILPDMRDEEQMIEICLFSCKSSLKYIKSLARQEW